MSDSRICLARYRFKCKWCEEGELRYSHEDASLVDHWCCTKCSIATTEGAVFDYWQKGDLKCTFDPHRDRKEDHIYLYQAPPIDTWPGWCSIWKLIDWMEVQPNLFGPNPKMHWRRYLELLLLHGMGCHYDQIDMQLRLDSPHFHVDFENRHAYIALKSDNNGTIFTFTTSHKCRAPHQYDCDWELLRVSAVPRIRFEDTYTVR